MTPEKKEWLRNAVLVWEGNDKEKRDAYSYDEVKEIHLLSADNVELVVLSP